ncbi:MAG: hypothetical protein IPM25_14370 [Chloracidobacterium sp.]|nr:hypothetical protein [Chloracidobacterium sp.]
MSRYVLISILVLSLISAAHAQKNVMWERVNIPEMDLFAGPGGDEMRPDLSKVEFVKEEKDGHNKKYRIKDGSGNVWVAKLGREARPETAAVRLLYGIGYKTEVNYLVPSITIPGKGTFRNVRLEARPDNVERLEEWKWKKNPFVGTRELQGLKILMVFMTNWDVLDLQNKVLDVGDENHYIISDLGATFGRLGNNNLPIIYRLGRKTGSPEHYAKTKLIRRVESDGDVILAYKGKNRDIFKAFTVEDARWLAGLMSQLSDKQIGDAFRAANFSDAEVAMYVESVKRKIAELRNAAAGNNLAGN